MHIKKGKGDGSGNRGGDYTHPNREVPTGANNHERGAESGTGRGAGEERACKKKNDCVIADKHHNTGI